MKRFGPHAIDWPDETMTGKTLGVWAPGAQAGIVDGSGAGASAQAAEEADWATLALRPALPATLQAPAARTAVRSATTVRAWVRGDMLDTIAEVARIRRPR